ncbi:hypothetical protein VT84_32045 [Gemmata sp. SH-PL17]|nr:hypothetical protein VT84_32045 [Gemmata sp. SH-PL17]
MVFVPPAAVLDPGTGNRSGQLTPFTTRGIRCSTFGEQKMRGAATTLLLVTLALLGCTASNSGPVATQSPPTSIAAPPSKQ